MTKHYMDKSYHELTSSELFKYNAHQQALAEHDNAMRTQRHAESHTPTYTSSSSGGGGFLEVILNLFFIGGLIFLTGLAIGPTYMPLRRIAPTERWQTILKTWRSISWVLIRVIGFGGGISGLGYAIVSGFTVWQTLFLLIGVGLAIIAVICLLVILPGLLVAAPLCLLWGTAVSTLLLAITYYYPDIPNLQLLTVIFPFFSTIWGGLTGGFGLTFMNKSNR